jgi:hypothetical protein
MPFHAMPVMTMAIRHSNAQISVAFASPGANKFQNDLALAPSTKSNFAAILAVQPSRYIFDRVERVHTFHPIKDVSGRLHCCPNEHRTCHAAAYEGFYAAQAHPARPNPLCPLPGVATPHHHHTIRKHC